MTINIGVVMDPIEQVNVKKDTTMAMLWAAAARGWQLYYLPQSSLWIENGVPMASMVPLTVSRDHQPWYQCQPAVTQAVDQLQVVLMRKDPPFDERFLHMTYLLDAVERSGVLVVNKPQSLRDCNEKLFATQFPTCCPPHIVSANHGHLMDFYRAHGDVIFKPLDGMGGSEIFRVKPDDVNVNVIIEVLTHHGKRVVMGQKYLPEIVDGDKRVLVIDGHPVDFALARIPKSGETRGNLAAGGTARAQPLSARDRWIAEQVAPTLQAKGLLFVGLDIIGDYLTEINVTSPTCVREIDAACGTTIADTLMQAIADKLV